MGLNLFFVAAIAILLPVFMAIFLARGVATFATAVNEVQEEVEREQKAYNPRLTAGHRILPTADVNEQLQTARRLAAKQAAALPRGANMKIGPRQDGRLLSAQDGIQEDPLTAVKIAAFHGWQGAMQGAQSGAAAAPAARQAGGAVRAAPQRELKPGVDYEWIEITDAMSPAEKRRARIANAKSKSAAVKALKAAGGGVAAPAAQAAAPAAEAAPAAPAADAFEAAMVDIPEPDLIEITDDMDPADVRKARIANAKAQSAYKKALKAAGVNPAAGPAATAASPQAAVPAEPTPVTEREPVAVPADIPAPELVEITDDMDPAEIRRARIANARAQSAYKKALKAAGIDPSSV